jgi:hypothetical protein
MDGRLPEDVNGRIEPGHTIRDRVRRELRRPNWRNRHWLTQLADTTRFNLQYATDELIAWAELHKEINALVAEGRARKERLEQLGR